MIPFFRLNKGTGPRHGSRFFGKTMVAAACAASLAFVACSQKAGKTSKTVVAPPDDSGNNPGVKKIVTKLDSLVANNKGKGVVTGYLTGEGKSLAAGILGKLAVNAAGERRMLTKSEIPLSGATILIFNSLKATTAADTTLRTDSLGNYTAILPEGQYFGFAVYLDLETFQLVTTSIPNLNPKADTVVKMDTATAIEDVTAPTVVGVFDAASANSDGIFLVGSIPDKNAKINVNFSEPMNRDSYKGVILGRIDTANTSTSMVLADTATGVTVSWSGDSKVMTLSVASLATGAQYGLILPTTLKDLAKNPLEKEYKATFVTAAAADLDKVDFQVASTFPADKDTLKPIQNPGVSFNRPVEVFSVLKNASISPAVTGYWEVNGARANFIHKDPLEVGKTYTVSLPVSVLDLSGKALKTATSFSFTVKDYEGAAKDNTGKEQQVALAVEAAFDAYLSGDIGRFGAAFHPNFRMYDENSIKSKTEFLDKIRSETADKASLAAGFPAPVFYDKADRCNELHSLWKVLPQGGGDEVWVSAYLNPGQSPMVYDKDFKAIAQTSLTWDPTGPRFTYNAKIYGYGPDMSKFKGPVNMDAAKDDDRFMSGMLQQTSTVALEPIKLETKDEFKVDPSVNVVGDTAKLAVKMIGYDKYSRRNFQDRGSCDAGSLSDTSYQILKFILVYDGSKWLITSIVSGEKIDNQQDFNKTIDAKNISVKQIMPINLTAPLKDKVMSADGKVTFKFNGPALDSIGGYLVGIAEDPKFCFGRSPYGALIFVKASNHEAKGEAFKLNSAGVPDSGNATAILRRVQDLKLPGWDRTIFENAITTLYDSAKGFGGVYQWKAIAVRDTSATQFLANGFSPDRYYAESDFGPTRGYFACKNYPTGDAAFNALQSAQTNFVNTQPVTGNSFSDADLDGVPDGIEAKYKTDPRNRNSYPDFRTDTDGDGIADFLEAMLDPKGTDSLIFKKADDATKKAEFVKLQALGIIWQDSDGDGFPDDIEMMLGFNPMDPNNNPGTRARVTTPLGAFTGKFQIGSNVNGISFRLYLDTSKALMVHYTAWFNGDTLMDSVPTAFNEMAGEVYVPVTLKSGPDAGKCLLLRGHYDPNMALLQGPIDMIMAPAKGSINFGSGPYMGQFAASARGEDVSRYLPANGGTTGQVVNNPVNTTNTGSMGYRPPPQGTDTGAVIVFNGTTAIYIGAFGDTLAVVPGANFRGQPDGSFDYDADWSYKTPDGKVYHHTQAGGHVFNDGQGNWVVDGHFFQESDTNGIHISWPGQMCGRVAKADFTIGLTGAKGSMKGWIFQDKTGGGFVSNPVNNQPVCDPTKGSCTTTNCDPTKTNCSTDPNQCPAGQVCNPATNPTTNYSRTYMSGAANYRMFVTAKLSLKDGDYFFVSMGGHVYRVKDDSVGVSNALSPMCGQVVLKLELLPMKDGSDVSKQAHNSDSMAFQMGQSIVVAIEDQYIVGQPAIMDKARDSYGDVHSIVPIVEMRPISLDYGKPGTQCPATNPIVQNPPCDSTKGPCNQPCDPTKATCTQPCDPTKTTCPQPCDPTKATCTQPCDPTKTTCNQPCDPTRTNCTQPCDPATANCTQPPPGGQPQPYMGSLDLVKAALVASANFIGVVKDSTGAYFRVEVNPLSLIKDPILQYVFVYDKAGASKYVLFADPSDKLKLAIRDNYPMAANPDQQPNNNPPTDTTHVVNNPPPADTLPPPAYTGTQANLETVMTQRSWKADMRTLQGITAVRLDSASLHVEGNVFIAGEAGNVAHLFIFLGEKIDPTKLALDANSMVLVREKPLTAGP
ncbi:MAG: Ig-like domain-containing protein [Fibrobacteres bacterium]|nr:Ig-like domain-containing protein [Fibrobacterota bacterium]